MPLKNSEFGDWEIIQDDPYIRAQHQETGETVTLHEDGQMDAPAVSTGEANRVTVAPFSDYCSAGSGVVGDPWILDLDGLMQSLSGEWAIIFFPPGLYEVTGPVDVTQTVGPYFHENEGEWQNRPPALVGWAKERTELRLADGVDDDFFYVVQPATEVKIDGWRIENLYFNGNKDSQAPAASDGDRGGGNFIYAKQEDEPLSRLKLDNVSVRWFPGDAFAPDGKDNVARNRCFNTSRFHRLDVKYCDGQGIQLTRDAYVEGSNFGSNGKNGIITRGSSIEMQSVKVYNNGASGLNFTSDNNCARGVWAWDNGQNVSVPHIGGNSLGDNNCIYGAIIESTASDGTSQAFGFDGEDNDLWGYSFTGSDAGSVSFGSMGTRGTVNGVGLNSGDPNSTGDWNGNGREGVNVADTVNNSKYLYRGGSWY
jgi:hypothetical protein